MSYFALTKFVMYMWVKMQFQKRTNRVINKLTETKLEKQRTFTLETRVCFLCEALTLRKSLLKP